MQTLAINWANAEQRVPGGGAQTTASSRAQHCRFGGCWGVGDEPMAEELGCHSRRPQGNCRQWSLRCCRGSWRSWSASAQIAECWRRSSRRSQPGCHRYSRRLRPGRRVELTDATSGAGGEAMAASATSSQILSLECYLAEGAFASRSWPCTRWWEEWIAIVGLMGGGWWAIQCESSEM